MLEKIISDLPHVSTDAITVAYRAPGAPNARYVFVNDAGLELFGYTPEEMIGCEVQMVHDPEQFKEFISIVEPRFRAGETRFTEESSCIRKCGTIFWSSMSFLILPTEADGGRYSVVVFRDISDLKNRELAAEAALAEREILFANLKKTQDRLMSAIDAFPDPFAMLDKNRALVLWNRAYALQASDDPAELQEGMTLREVLGLSVRNGRFPEAIGREDDWLDEAIKKWGHKDSRKNEMLSMPNDRHYRLMKSVAPTGDTLVLRNDVTDVVRKERELEEYARQLERANREISHQALSDELTGLGNRRWLASELERLLRHRRKAGGEIAALHVDLDRFKEINDTLGHEAGDHVLREVASRLIEEIRSEDVLARIGGDEFVVLVHSAPGASSPEQLAARIVANVAAPVYFKGKECRFGASVGIAQTPLAQEKDLLTSSDLALYKAKNAGRSQTARFERLDLEHVRQNKALADDILRGIEAGEFIPFFQPQIEAKTEKVVALEALARWRHPDRGIVAPCEFTPTAHKLGVMALIDDMIFEKAISECRQFFAGRDVTPALAFNISGKRVLGMEKTRLEIATSYTGDVTFELLETIFFEDEGDQFFANIDLIRESGIGIELDDFGSGHASLVALQRLAPDRMKIDRRLVAPVDLSDRSRKLVESIVAIGKTLAIEVTAEGVETSAQANILKELGCDRLQGFHFARPALLDDLDILRTGREPKLNRVTRA